MEAQTDMPENLVKLLAEALQCVQEGDISFMVSTLVLARMQARDAGVNIIDRTVEIEQLGYRRVVESSLAEAQQYAQRGDSLSMGLELLNANEYAKQAGLNTAEKANFISRVAEIKQIWHIWYREGGK